MEEKLHRRWVKIGGKKGSIFDGNFHSILSVFCILFAFSFGWNLSGQFMGVFGILFGGLGVGSFLKPDSVGEIAAQILENMQKNAEKENRPSNKKKITTTQIIAKGDVYHISESKNTKINSPKKSSKRTKN